MQDDPFMIGALKEDHIIEPSEQPYNFTVSPQSVITFEQLLDYLYSSVF